MLIVASTNSLVYYRKEVYNAYAISMKEKFLKIHF